MSDLTSEEEQFESAVTSRLRLESLQLMPSGSGPYFTWVVVMAQFSMLIWWCSTATFAEIGLSPKVHQRIEPASFRGNVTVSFTEWPNPFIGPSGTHLVSFGALLPPCIREDHALNAYQVQTWYLRPERGVESLGCCEVPHLNIAGTTTEEAALDPRSVIKTRFQSTHKDRVLFEAVEGRKNSSPESPKGVISPLVSIRDDNKTFEVLQVECRVLSNDTAQWRNTQCSQRSASQSTVQHTLRPCCGELDGQCTLTSPQHCWFMNGRFHLDAEHCSQVDCLQQLCILGDQSVADNYDTQFSPRRSHQWWRFVTSIYLQHGIVDCLVITFLQIWLYWGQENSVGWLRMAIVHHTAGIGGHLIGSLFTRHNWPEAGAGPAVGGIMGLALVEHVILWRTIKNPRSRLTLLVICLCVLFLIGTLPQVNNYSLITGLFYGCLCALVLWSPIVFQGKLTRCKFVFVFVIVTMLLFSLALFYGVQQIDLNSFDYVNCMPYADGLCN